MIALGARAPQVDPLGGAIRNNAAMISMAAQQQALQRQNAIAEQNLRIQQAQEQRAGAKAGQEASAAEIELAKNAAAVFKEKLNILAPGDVRGAAALRHSIVSKFPDWDAVMPAPEAIANDPGTRQRLLMTADKVIEYTVPKPTASVQFGKKGGVYGVTVGGLNAPRADEVTVSSRAGQSAPAAPATAPMAAAPMVDGAGLPPQLAQAAVSDNYAAGILRSAFASKTISPSDAAKVRAALPPEADAAFFGWLQANKISLPSKRGDGMPLQRTTPPQSGYESKLMDDNEVGTQFIGRDPMQSPLPGSAAVPLKRVRAEAEAESAGRTAGSTKSPAQLEAEGYASKKGELRATQEKSSAEDAAAAKGALLSVRQQIKNISELYDSPALPYITGGLRGSLPTAVNALTGGGQAAFDAQALASNVVDTSALEKLLEIRRNSPTGASVGNVSDKDIILLKNSAAVLQQTQGTPAYQKHLLDYLKLLRSVEARLSGTAGETIDRNAPQEDRVNYIQGLLDSGATKAEVNSAAKDVGLILNQSQLDANLAYRAKGRRARIAAPKPSAGGMPNISDDVEALLKAQGL